MTKPMFQAPILLDAEDTAFVHFAKAKGLGKSRAAVVRNIITAHRLRCEAGFKKWLLSPEGQAVIRAEGLGAVSLFGGPVAKAQIAKQAVDQLLAGQPVEAFQESEAAPETPIEGDNP